MYVRRPKQEPREPVDEEDQLDLPRVGVLCLASVIYHRGNAPEAGHYSITCRRHRREFWYYDDHRAVAPVGEQFIERSPMRGSCGDVLRSRVGVPEDKQSRCARFRSSVRIGGGR